MTKVTLTIDVLMIPVLVVIFAVWCAIGAGVVRRMMGNLLCRSGRVNCPTFFDPRGCWDEFCASLKPFSVGRLFGVFYRRPTESMLVWVALLIGGALLIAAWAALTIAAFGHYP
jgi:hypothetical protein